MAESAVERASERAGPADRISKPLRQTMLIFAASVVLARRNLNFGLQGRKKDVDREARFPEVRDGGRIET